MRCGGMSQREEIQWGRYNGKESEDEDRQSADYVQRKDIKAGGSRNEHGGWIMREARQAARILWECPTNP